MDKKYEDLIGSLIVCSSPTADDGVYIVVPGKQTRWSLTRRCEVEVPSLFHVSPKSWGKPTNQRPRAITPASADWYDNVVAGNSTYKIMVPGTGKRRE